MMYDPYTPLQVTEAIAAVNELLESAYPVLMIEGEVSGFKVNQGKYVFFDLKDKEGGINCFMMVFQLKFPLEDGMKVQVLAQPKVTQWGKLSFTVREVVPVGEGSLKKSFELLKAKLEKEGLFEKSKKRPLPKNPERIGVVSSSGAAGYADFLKILENRWSGLHIILIDVPVQGIEAPAQVSGAIRHLNEMAEPVDVIAIIRGGGSADDLAAFSSEAVVRAVAASRIPTIVGVGHEVDESLADFAADRRAATPSNAAEILVPDKLELLRTVAATKRIAKNGVDAAIRVFMEDTEQVKISIEKEINALLEAKEQKLRMLQNTVRLVDPRAVLRRGYSLVKVGGRVISSKQDVTIDDELQIQLKDGNIEAIVKHV